jgi:general stress protein 26
MNTLAQTAPAFVAMAHSIVWCNVATVDSANRPRSRVLHPFWEFDGDRLVGWVATAATPIKKAHLAHSSYCSLNYWTTCHDTCAAECAASWCEDSQTKQWVWTRYLELPEPVGYNPAIIPGWEGPDSPGFSVLRFAPWRLRVFPGLVLMGQAGEVLTWQA